MDFTTDQNNAINSRGMSVAVSAAAGSGKTAVLTRRIIERVCAPDGDISRILAVTYTKAAAVEILARLSKAISEKLAEDPSNKHVARQSLLVSSARVSTVHRFCLDVIHEYFDQLGLPSDFSVGDETNIKIISEKVMDKLVDDLFEGNVEGDEKIDDFALLYDTLGGRSNKNSFSETMMKFYEKLSCKADFLDAIDNYIQMYKNVDASNIMGTAWGFELKRFLRTILEHYLKMLVDAERLGSVNPDYLPTETAFAYDRSFCEFALSKLDTSDYAELCRVFLSYEPPTLKFARGAAKTAERKRIHDFREEFKNTIRKKCTPYFAFSEREIEFTFAETAKRLSEIKTFLASFNRRFKEEKTRRRIITYSDMEHYALRVLWDRENDAPSEAAIRIRDGFDEIFVDEYQDTNEVQNKIFSLVSKNNNLFTVGDVKQSIYGFRGADPTIFEGVLDDREKYSEGMTGDRAKIFLSMNFRSSNEILGFCNEVFDVLMNVGKKRYGDDEKLYPGLRKSLGDVEISVLPAGQKDDYITPEEDFVARRVAAFLKEGRKPSDIAILLRKGTAAVGYERALKRLNIPVKNTEDKAFFENGEVLLMLSLLCVIDNPARDVYLAATLKSQLFGVTLDELIYIRKYADGSLYDALCAFTEQTGFKKGKHFLAFLEKFRALAPSVPCDRLIWQIYLDTNILSVVGSDKNLENYEAEQAKANLIQLYNFARSFGKNTYRGLFDFISFINDVIEKKEKVKLSPFKTAGDAVSILTIHGSKGLEFPVCFVSDTAGQFNRDDERGNLLITKFGVATKLRHPSGLGQIRPLTFDIMKNVVRQSTVEDETRLLYVALTRAREKLIVTASSSEPISLGDGGEYARRAKYISEYSLFSAKSFFDLIGMSVAGRGGYRVVGAGDIDAATPKEKEKKIDDVPLSLARRVVNERLSFRYPYEVLTEVPAKVAVSDLYPDLLDDGEEEIKEAKFDYVPRFLAGDDEYVTAAERGTATHTFMQFFDFDRVEKDGVRAEIEYLARHKFIFDTDKKKIDVRGIEMFLRSDIAKKIRNAKKIWREKRFILSLDAADFSMNDETKAALGDEKLLVQGVIDCAYLDDDGKIVVVDYKTDHFARGTARDVIEKTLIERHTRQLMYYKTACDKLFGEVKSVLVYSFAIGDTVEIFGG